MVAAFETPADPVAFAALQRSLVDRFERFRADPTQPYTAVVVPSQSFDGKELAKIDGVAHYEERALFNLMLLRRPRLTMVFVTSKRLDPLIIDYYLHLIRGVPRAHAHRRLILMDCDDASPRPLTEKILERPRLIDRIRERIRDPSMAHLASFNSSALERSLALRLGIPINGCDPDLATELGGKTGCRRVIREAGVDLPRGREGLSTYDDVVRGVTDLWDEMGAAGRIVVKLNHSFSGEGNALLDLRAFADVTGSAARREVVRAELPNMRFEAKGLTWEPFVGQIETMGGICEEWIEGDKKASPSVQLRINPLGEVQAVSTHDQILGGPTGQIFSGATFPANPAYRMEIQALGKQVGKVLAQHGVVGRSAIDFVVVPDPASDEPRIYAIEINIRQGGTTHPFNTLKSITGGEYNEEEGAFYTAQGRERCYFATDTLAHPRYRGILPFDLIDRLVVDGIHFRSDDTGVVFHLLGCLSQYGKLGCTSIAPTVPEAKKLFRETVEVLDRLMDE